MKIVIITDGNNQQGLGHIYQSKTLAAYLQEVSPLEIKFLTKSEEYIVDIIKKDGFNVVRLKSDDEIFNYLIEDLPNIVIFDKIDVSSLLARKIKQELDLKLVIFTNLTDANEFADISILADIGSDFENICEEKGGKIKYWGPRYWLMRPEFYNYNIRPKEYSKQVRNITIIFGGADPYDYTSLILEQLMSSIEQFSIDVILGAAYKNEHKIHRIISLYKNSKCDVHILRNVENVAELMFCSDLVFVSPGLSLFEALKVGTPILAFFQSDLQKDIYNGYIPTYGKEDVYNVVNMIITRTFVFPYDEFIFKMEIGDGKKEIVDQILNNV